MPVHTFAPVYDEKSKVLILGSFPSVKSRELGFYYGHAQNRFWPLMAHLLGENVPCSTEEKCSMLLSHGIALWDVISSCDIDGSSDASIRNAVPNDIGKILKYADIRAVFANGATAARLYNRFCEKRMGQGIVLLPSTSAANASYSFERLCTCWQSVISALDN